MIISYDHRFVVFLPWKTASQTTTRRLSKFNQSPYSSFFHFNKFLNRVVHQHLTCAEFLSLPDNELSLFKASFVRNPYDRCYSAFLQIQRDIEIQPNATFPENWIRELVIRQLHDNRAQLEKANYEFNEWMNLVREDQILEVGRNTNFPLHPSYYWTHVAGRQYVDFIGRVENFESDFSTLLSHLKLDDTIDPINENVSEDLNNSLGRYRHVNKMSKRSIEQINSLFSCDFDIFKYKKLVS